MSSTKKLFLVLCLILITNCSKENSGIDTVNPASGDEVIDDEPIPVIDPIPVTDPTPVIDPEPVTLIFPENRTECNEGVPIDDEWSLVNFQWNASEDTDSYEIWVKNSKNSTWQSRSTDTTEIELKIVRGAQFQWNVISKNTNSAKKATSETWEFYNSGTGAANYAPFTPTLIHPRNEQILKSGDNYYFQWTTSDLDNDPLIFELFVGSHTDSLHLVKTLSAKQEFIYDHIKHKERSFWKVHASDNQGNISKSEIYSFIRL